MQRIRNLHPSVCLTRLGRLFLGTVIKVSKRVAQIFPVYSKSAKSNLKSGMYQKSSYLVLFPELWPNIALMYEYVSESADFKALDSKMFVAG